MSDKHNNPKPSDQQKRSSDFQEPKRNSKYEQTNKMPSKEIERGQKPWPKEDKKGK